MERKTIASFQFVLDCVDWNDGKKTTAPEKVNLRVERWRGSNGWRTMYCAQRDGRLGWDCTASTPRQALLAQTWKGKAARPKDVAEAVKVVAAALKGTRAKA